MRTCFLSSQMNAIGEFSAPLNGVRRGHPEKMSSLQKQETLQLTDVENLSQKRAARHEAGRPLEGPKLRAAAGGAQRRLGL
jgi:hypothetical protein